MNHHALPLLQGRTVDVLGRYNVEKERVIRTLGCNRLLAEGKRLM